MTSVLVISHQSALKVEEREVFVVVELSMLMISLGNADHSRARADSRNFDATSSPPPPPPDIVLFAAIPRPTARMARFHTNGKHLGLSEWPEPKARAM